MSLSNNIIKSSSLLLLTKFINRGIGLISTLILARLLTPEDYGIVAIATVAIYLFDEISNTGTREYVIHKTTLDNDILNTAWTLNLVTKIIVWLAFLLLIPVISEFYSKPELNDVLLVISLILPIGALRNVGIIIYEKELKYKPLFYLELCQKIIAFIFILSIALWLKSYWAMIIGTVISSIVLNIGSYIIHDFRPKFSLYNFKEQWSFSKWMLPKGLLGFSKAEFDVFLISRIFDFSNLGGFNLMKSLTSMVGRDVIMPATDPLLSSFSKVKGDFERLNFQLTLSLFVILVISLPMTLFIWMFHKEIVLILLGEQWVSYSSVLGVLSLLIATFSLSGILQHLLTSLGKIKVQFYFELFGLIFTVITLIVISFDDLVEFSFVRSLLALALVILMLFYVKKLVKLSIVYFLSLLLPIFFSLIVASIFVLNIHIGEDMPLILYLLFYGFCFFISYSILLIVTLYFYRSRMEIIYLRWVINQTVGSVLNKFRAAG